MIRRQFALFVTLALALLTVAAARPVAASQAETEFGFHVGDSFITKFGLPPADVSQAANGDTITVVGTGGIDTEDMEVHGQGTFEHRSSDGTLLASGTWQAKELITFDNFGPQAGLPPDFRGGHAAIRVRVTAHPAVNPDVTIRFDATLVVDCALGDVPPGVEEGITFDAGFINFNQKVSGFTLFVAETDD